MNAGHWRCWNNKLRDYQLGFAKKHGQGEDKQWGGGFDVSGLHHTAQGNRMMLARQSLEVINLGAANGFPFSVGWTNLKSKFRAFAVREGVREAKIPHFV